MNTNYDGASVYYTNQSTPKYVLHILGSQLKHPRTQMFTSLDRWSVIFKFPPLRFNFYQAPSPRRSDLSRQIFSSVSFFPPSMALTRLPSIRIFLSLKLEVGSPNSTLPTRVVITKQNHTVPRCADSQHRIFNKNKILTRGVERISYRYYESFV